MRYNEIKKRIMKYGIKRRFEDHPFVLTLSITESNLFSSAITSSSHSHIFCKVIPTADVRPVLFLECTAREREEFCIGRTCVSNYLIFIFLFITRF